MTVIQFKNSNKDSTQLSRIIHTHTYPRTLTTTHTHTTCMQANTYIYIYKHISIYTHTCKKAHTHTHTHARARTHTLIYINRLCLRLSNTYTTYRKTYLSCMHVNTVESNLLCIFQVLHLCLLRCHPPVQCQNALMQIKQLPGFSPRLSSASLNNATQPAGTRRMAPNTNQTLKETASRTFSQIVIRILK